MAEVGVRGNILLNDGDNSLRKFMSWGFGYSRKKPRYQFRRTKGNRIKYEKGGKWSTPNGAYGYYAKVKGRKRWWSTEL